jgi:hypothetical protein
VAESLQGCKYQWFSNPTYVHRRVLDKMFDYELEVRKLVMVALSNSDLNDIPFYVVTDPRAAMNP